MKKLIKNPNSLNKIFATNKGNNVFTPANILELLSQIHELENCNIEMSEGLDGALQFTIDGSVYEIAEGNQMFIK
ncbi:MAG: hypothetical protein Q8876_07015 [Bacillota bacterium]|nr:hypothetical protein [Bacillota bacterium]